MQLDHRRLGILIAKLLFKGTVTDKTLLACVAGASGYPSPGFDILPRERAISISTICRAFRSQTAPEESLSLPTAEFAI